jgi:hypothetical protein
MPTLLFLALTTLPPQAACTPQFAALETGSHSGASKVPFWRKEQAGEWGGKGWLGWTWKGQTLRPVRLIVQDRTKHRADDDDEVNVVAVPDMTFAVRCIPGLRAGRIPTTRVLNESLVRERPLEMSLDRRQYQVGIRSAREDLVDAQVILTDGDRTQVLYSADGFADEPHFDIKWAGDLDRDGKLDLVVDLSRKYSVHLYRLLLSSKASGAQLVGEAAVFDAGND